MTRRRHHSKGELPAPTAMQRVAAVLSRPRLLEALVTHRAAWAPPLLEQGSTSALRLRPNARLAFGNLGPATPLLSKSDGNGSRGSRVPT